MNLAQYVDDLRHQLLVAAEAGGKDATALAERLTAPLEAATRLVILEALSAAANEITRDIAPGSVDVRLRGRDPEFVVTPPPNDRHFDDMAAVDTPVTSPAPVADSDDGGTSRITLRLPESLKPRAEAAAATEGISLNTWLVRAAAAALDPADRNRHTERRGPSVGQRYSGWVR